MQLRSLLRRHRSNIALVIGNGINRYGAAPRTNSWNDLLLVLAKKYLGRGDAHIPEGIALTEFYDLLELQSGPGVTGKSLQKEFSDLLQDWTPYEHHQRIVAWAQAARVPVLTTNFEKTLRDAGQCQLFHMTRSGFTDFYPWETYYGREPLTGPAEGFGIWHINGMARYHRSIRLGLTHYMGCVERARGLIHKGNETRLFSGKNVDDWAGAKSWLHVVFNRALLIFGLGLDQNEVFLRWLLIERARYFQKFGSRKQPAWYAHPGEADGSGKLYFLKGVGVTPLRVKTYDELYGAETWE